jgi:hypothetical protein
MKIKYTPSSFFLFIGQVYIPELGVTRYIGFQLKSCAALYPVRVGFRNSGDGKGPSGGWDGRYEGMYVLCYSVHLKEIILAPAEKMATVNSSKFFP